MPPARLLLSLLAALLALAAAVAARAAEGPAPNRLIDSGSPYLLQHARNPVRWYPWGPEALEIARRENKPIFLSVGYSTCYWCHVANRTLYQEPAIAALMNEWFVCVKVDREQRPDVDALYMLATQLLTGGGGWPNNVFLTPEGLPVFAGSYFPPHDDDFGRPGFVTVMTKIHEDWVRDPEVVRAYAGRVADGMKTVQAAARDAAGPADPAAWRARAVNDLLAEVDREHGGFRSADRDAKFPQSPRLVLLLDEATAGGAPAREALVRTLDAMARGGLRDHVGGGFHRYTVDRAWSIPHFEKMLYDNAQLLGIYARAWTLTGNPRYRDVGRGTADYLLGRLADPAGGFYTAEDAEIGGEEGASYLWSEADLRETLGADSATRLLAAYTIVPLAAQRETDPFAAPGRGVLRLVAGDIPPATRFARERALLLAAREARPQPARDEKIVIALNGLAIESLAASARLLGEPRCRQAAARAANRIWTLAYDHGAGRLSHEIFRGRAQGEGFLDDYAQLGLGFLALADAGAGRVWRERAARLAGDALRRFGRPDGSLALTPAEKELIMPPPDNGDGAHPSGVSAALALFTRLAAGGDRRFREAADRLLESAGPAVAANPDLWPSLLAAATLPKGTSATPRPSAAQALRPDSGQAPATTARAPGTPPGTADHVRASARVRRDREADEVTVAIAIDPGYHVNANPASHDYLIATAVEFEGVAGAQLSYPAATLFRPAFARDGIRVYEGSIEIVARLPAGTLARTGTLRGTLTAQACTDEVCLPPARVDFGIELE